MKTENAIRAIAGFFILLSLALGWLVSPYWYLFTAFVGINLFQSAFTGTADEVSAPTVENTISSLPLISTVRTPASASFGMTS